MNIKFYRTTYVCKLLARSAENKQAPQNKFFFKKLDKLFLQISFKFDTSGYLLVYKCEVFH